jgi:hypothetical protein
VKSRLPGVLGAIALLAGIVPAVLTLSPAPAGASPATEWTPAIQSTPGGLSTPWLSAVSCTSAAACTAVGGGYSSTGSLTPIGANLVSGPSTWGTSALSFSGGQVSLSAISCVSSTWCMAVGYLKDSRNSTHLVAATENNGTWTIDSNLLRATYAYPGGGYLQGVSCTSQTFCMAVGYQLTSSYVETPIIEEFDGSSWTPVTLAYGSSPAVQDPVLMGVSCADPTDCAAVGGYYSGTAANDHSLAVVLSGTTWTVLESLDDTSSVAAGYLNSVSCPAPGQCEAVGQWLPNYASNYWGLAGSLDGTTWQPDYYDAQPPDAYSSSTILTSVSCVTPSACAVAGYDRPGSVTQGIVETDSNGAWHVTPVQPAGVPGAAGALLYSVSCSSDFACQAAGYSWGSDGSYNLFTAAGTAPPSLVVPSDTSFTQGTPVAESFTATGSGPLTISEQGTLPPGLSFTDAGSSGNTDVATLSGTPGPYTGTYSITVTVSDAAGASQQYYYGFTVQPLGPNPPQVLRVSPNTVGATGGTTITITGKYFTNVLAVLIDGSNAPRFTVVSSTKITAVAPPYSGSGVHVTERTRGGMAPMRAANLGSPDGLEVVTAQGASIPTYAAQFTYSGPALTGSTPLSGTENSFVYIKGQYLDGASRVTFGGVTCSKFTVNATGTQISAVVPYGVGSLDYISVTTPTGTDYLWGAFLLAAPAVTGVLPHSGPYGGGNTVTVTGTDMESVYEVDFGGVASPQFSINSTGTQITAVAPAGPAGYVPVTVVSPSGTSSTSGTSDLYQYNAPTILSVKPSHAAVGSLITVFGLGLGNIQTVYFGSVSVPAEHVYYDHNSYFVVQVPPNPGAGTVDIRVVNPAGESAVTSLDHYTY